MVYRDAEPAPILPGATLSGADSPDAGRWALDDGPGLMDALLIGADHGDLDVAGTLTLDAAAGVLAFRFDPETGAGCSIEIRPGSRTVTPRKLTLTVDRWTGQRGFRDLDCQRGDLREPYDRGTALPFRPIASGPAIGLTLGDEVILSTLSGEVTTGRVGFWLDDGTGHLDDGTGSPLRPVPIRA